MQYNLTARQIQLEQDIHFKLRLADVYKGFADELPESAAKWGFQSNAETLCNEAAKLGLEYEKLIKAANTFADVLIQNNLS